jgi:ferritin
MEIGKTMADEINKQINAEFYSAYLYFAMAGYFDEKGLPGFASWMKAQAKEELEHGEKFYEYLVERGGKFVPMAIEKPESTWSGPLEAFEQSLAHEQKVTGMIDSLYEAACAEKDNATKVFLQWFISEQVEEEATVTGIIDKLKLSGDKPQALLMLDRELGSRE